MEYRPPPPCDTQLPSGMLFITMFYTCRETEVVYHGGGGGASYRKKCKVMYSPIKKYRDIHKNLRRLAMVIFPYLQDMFNASGTIM